MGEGVEDGARQKMKIELALEGTEFAMVVPTVKESARERSGAAKARDEAAHGRGLDLARRIAGVPRGQLAMQKMVVNQVMLTMGLEQTQMLATIFDGISRHNPEGLWFRRYAQTEGFKAAVKWRDSGRPIPEGDEARRLIREMEEQWKKEG